MSTSGTNVESLWRQIAVPVIAGIVLAVASALVGYIKLVSTSIADPYAGNIHWEPCLKKPFSHPGKCFFTGYRVVNKSSQPTEKPVKFDFEIYKPVDAHLIPTRLPRKFRGKRPTVSSTAQEAKIIVISSSEVETEFEVYAGSVPWEGEQDIEGWHRVIATFQDGIPADDEVDIVTLYFSYPPIQSIKIGPKPLSINEVAYPDVASNNKAIVQQKMTIAQQRRTLIIYWILFFILIVLTISACTWAVRKYTEYRSKLTHIQEELEKNLHKEKERKREFEVQRQRESELEEEFAMKKEDGEVKDRRFEVALSFPGERRDFVEKVSSSLVNVFGQDKVFYDKNFEAELARPDLDTYLQKLYHDDSDLIVVFLCGEYEKKEWCGLEWRAIRDLIKKRQLSDIMPFRFDDTHIHGLFSIDGYINIGERSPEQIAKCIIERYKINQEEREEINGDKKKSSENKSNQNAGKRKKSRDKTKTVKKKKVVKKRKSRKKKNS